MVSFRNSDDIKQWRAARDYLKEVMDAGVTPQTIMPAVREAFKDIGNSYWGTQRYIFTLGAQDTDKLITLCSNNILSWQIVFNAKACLGSAEDLQKIYQAGQAKGKGPNLNEALGFASCRTNFCEGEKSSGSLEAAEQLLKLGADPSYDPSGTYRNALDENGIEMGKLFVRYGLSSAAMLSQMQWAESNKKPPLYKKAREIYWEHGRYAAIDPYTVVETKLLEGEKNKLKIIFNFSAERVSEIYEWTNPDHPPVMRDFKFEDYNQAALDIAHRKLVDLGGQPPDAMQLDGKKVTVREIKRGLGK